MVFKVLYNTKNRSSWKKHAFLHLIVDFNWILCDECSSNTAQDTRKTLQKTLALEHLAHVTAQQAISPSNSNSALTIGTYHS